MKDDALDGADSPYLKGFAAPVREERDDRDLTIEGELPGALRGVFLKNGPNPQFPPRGAFHPFDGDGMVHAVWLEDGRARYRNRWVRTPGFSLEREHGRPLFGGFADLNPPDPIAMAKVGPVKHVANTSMVAHAGKWLALWEGGMPYALDQELQTVGLEQFGSRYAGPLRWMWS